jgi:hypothetical protein
MNVRIWIYHRGSIVKITVRPEKPVVVRQFEYTDEGYNADDDRYEIDGDSVVLNSYSRSRDCDGPFDSHRVYSWPIGGPTCPMIGWDGHGNSYELGVDRPIWKAGQASQRDYFAESMGY